jgi:hypothetical protein
MDPDQDLLDALDRKEGLSTASVAAMIIGVSIIAGGIAYLSLITERFSREVSFDGAVLIALGMMAGLAFGYRKASLSGGPGTDDRS